MMLEKMYMVYHTYPSYPIHCDIIYSQTSIVNVIAHMHRFFSSPTQVRLRLVGWRKSRYLSRIMTKYDNDESKGSRCLYSHKPMND